jgi:hypothetical protein
MSKFVPGDLVTPSSFGGAGLYENCSYTFDGRRYTRRYTGFLFMPGELGVVVATSFFDVFVLCSSGHMGWTYENFVRSAREDDA